MAEYAKEAEKMEPDKLTESALVTQWQRGLEHHRPNGTHSSFQTTKDAAGRALYSSRQGLPKVKKQGL